MMKTTKILFWVFTILFGGFMLFSGIQNAMVSEASVKLIHDQLGYPKNVIAFLGVAKILGAICILIPGFPRLKEWAYAGLFFDLSGALFSSISAGEPMVGPDGGWIFMLIFFIFWGLSYFYYHKLRKTQQK